MEALSSTDLPNESRGWAIDIIIWIGFGVSTSFVGARLFTRLKIQRNPGWDDWILLSSVIINLVSTTLITTSVAHGLGHHIQHISAKDLEKTLYYAAILQVFGIFAVCVPKFVVVILLIKLMGPKKRGNWFLYGILLILFICSVLCAIFIFAQCNPPSHFWHPLEPADCMSPLVLQRITLFTAAWSAFVDLCLALFPITIFWDLRMPIKKKISISVIMGLGVIAMVCAIVKTTFLPNEQRPDFTWEFYNLVVWTFVEINIYISCACVPVFPQLVSFLRGRKDSFTTPHDVHNLPVPSPERPSRIHIRDDISDPQHLNLSGVEGLQHCTDTQLETQIFPKPEVYEKGVSHQEQPWNYV